jgi:membrane-bound ClpP family serine protease
MGESGKQLLEDSFACLEERAPDRVSRAIRWVRDPKARLVRLPLGVLLVMGGLLSFLPVLGIELLPLGLLLLAVDIPFLRKPVALATLWLERKWLRCGALRREDE